MNDKESISNCIPQQEGQKAQRPSIGEEVEKFVERITGLASALPVVKVVVSVLQLGRQHGYLTFMQTFGDVDGEGDEQTYTVQSIYAREASRLESRVNQANLSATILPRSFVVALVSQFDFFIGRLLGGVPSVLYDDASRILCLSCGEAPNFRRRGVPP